MQILKITCRATVTIACAMAAAPSFAADLPSRQAPAPYIAPVPVFTWTGFYVGANAGYAFASKPSSSFAVPAGTFGAASAASIATTGTGSRDGFVGGGQVGYNYQFGHFVVGVETDLQYADIRRSQAGTVTYTGTATVPASFTFVSPRNAVDWFGTVRGRVGYAFDRVLVYGTGGLAYGGGSNGYCYTGTCDSTRVGYAAGAGVEYAITPNWSAKVEGLYVDLGKSGSAVYGYNSAGTVYTTSASRGDTSFGLVRAGVNYKF